MGSDIVEIRDIPTELEEEDVWACLGSREKAVPALADEVAKGIALCRTVCSPRGLYARLTVEQVERKKVSFVDGPALEGKFIAHCFEGAREAVFLVTTIGPAVEARVSELFAEGESVEAVVLDAVGSASVMRAFTYVANRIVEETIEREWQTGLCLTPGQSYWDIAGQKTVFQVVQAGRIGVELLDSCFMVPQKSQSAVIPLGPDLKIHGDSNESQCRYCKATRCPMRAEPSIL